jgi:hypothetical protein
VIDKRARLVRVVDFVAETLEEEASRIPATYKSRADSLRNMAAIFRKMNNPKMVRVWEVEPEQAKA